MLSRGLPPGDSRVTTKLETSLSQSAYLTTSQLRCWPAPTQTLEGQTIPLMELAAPPPCAPAMPSNGSSCKSSIVINSRSSSRSRGGSSRRRCSRRSGSSKSSQYCSRCNRGNVIDVIASMTE